MAVSKEKLACSVPDEILAKSFTFLDKEQIGELCPYLELKELAPDEILMEEGKTGDFMAFLVQGQLVVKKETEFTGRHIILAVLDEGSMVGEIAVVERGLHSAMVTAKTPCLCLILTGENMELILRENPRLGVKLMKKIHHVLGIRLQKSSDRLSKVL